MKTGMITQWYEPETGAAAHPSAIARSLAEHGHDVRVLTGFPSYPHGQIYPGYRMSLRQREERDGLSLLRVPAHHSHDDSAVRRALSLSSFSLSAATQVGWFRDTDACLVYLTPATVGLPAVLLKTLWRTPFVLYVQDLWPDSVTASGFVKESAALPAIERTLRGMCVLLYRQASSIAVIAPGMRDVLVDRGVDPGKIHVVHNWVDEQVFQPTPPDERFRGQLGDDGFWLMYAGGIGDIQRLETAVDALALLPSRPEVRLALVGDGVAVKRLKIKVAALGLHDRVRFFGHRTMAEMPGIMSAADAQLVCLQDLPLFRATIPSKTQSVLACGRPLIVSAPGDAAELVERADAGVSCRPEDPQALADAIEHMLAQGPAGRRAMGQRGRALYEREFASSVGGRRLTSLLEDAAGARVRPRVSSGRT
ncbi:MAG: glycosyltransferase family 4 protein [Nocardioidaceae bacterium]